MSGISRRDFLHGMALAAGACAWPSLGLGQTGAAPAVARSARGRPNVLFIAVDDLRPELGCYGKKHVLSPNIDRLAAAGTVFDRAYCQQAVCSPSRTSLLTGCRPDTTRVYDLVTHFRKSLPDVVTLPQHFKNSGYHVAGLSKIYHGTLNDERSWSVPWWRPDVSAYQLNENIDRLRERLRQAKQASVSAGSAADVRGAAYESADVPDNAYADGATADKAIGMLRQMGDRPFFLATGFLKPHLPFIAPKKYWDLYQRDEIRLADNPYPPKHFPAIAGASWGELRRYDGIAQQGAVPDETARTLIHGYLACVSYVDAQIGRVIDELDRLGLRERTVIVLWGDHGWKLGEHGMWCKHTNFELDTRSTLICSVPGQKAAGAHAAGLTEFVDVYPTLCELCGLDKPRHLEGLSFAPLLGAPDRPWKQAAFSQYPRGHSIMGYSIRTDRHRYTEWQRKSGTPEAVELYDHATDPNENDNVVRSGANQETVKRLAAALKAGWRGALPAAESALLPVTASEGLSS